MRVRRTSGAVAILAAVAAGVASASVLVPAPGDDTLGGPSSVQPVPGSARGPFALTPDPDGGRSWAVRVYTSQDGLTCPELGQADAGRFGRENPDGTFSELEVQAGGSCADLRKSELALARRHHGATGTEVLFGVLASDDITVSLQTTSGVERIAADHRAFVYVAAGAELDGAVVRVSGALGTREIALAPNAD